MRKLLLLSIASMGICVWAQLAPKVSGPFDVVAPLLNGAPATGARVSGQIYFDVSGPGFMGIDNNGNVAPLTIVNPVHRVLFTGGSSTTPCSSSPCTIQSQDGSWVSSVDWLSTGAYKININTGVFTQQPTCTCSAAGGALIAACTMSSLATSTYVQLYAFNGTNFYDSVISLICSGN